MQEDSNLKLLLYKLALLIPDRWYIMAKYYKNFGKLPNLRNPKTFNEKLQWLKLHDHRSEYTQMVDKYEAKKYVAEIIGDEYIIPTLGVWDRAEDIDFGALPEQFVLKATHDSGRVIICKDKSRLNTAKAIEEMKHSLNRNFYAVTREWPYKNVKPRIIAEQYMQEDDGSELKDYKVHNFNGVPRVILVCQNRFKESGLTEDFYSQQWERLDISRPSHPNSKEETPRPQELDTMLKLSKKLSATVPFMRTDFYTINHHVYFGEITLYPASGSVPFVPAEVDQLLGSWIDLHPGATVEILTGGGKLLIYNNLYIFLRHNVCDSLNDYKFFCFNGIPKFFKIDFGRFTEHHANYYDIDGNLQPFGEQEFPPKPEKKLPLPQTLPTMTEIARKLSQGIPFVRVDLYEINGKVYFGELTFFPASGTGKLTPPEWNEKVGDLLEFPY